MAETGSFALLMGADAWTRCSHDQTALRDGVVSLQWQDPDSSAASSALPPRQPGGLAFDSTCRLFRSLPDAGRVQRWLWAVASDVDATDRTRGPVDLFASPAAEDAPGGGFVPVERDPQRVRRPLGLAVDAADRLYVAESDARRVLVVDLWQRRVVATVALPGRPLDVRCRGREALVLVASSGSTPTGIARLSRTGLLAFTELSPELDGAQRLVALPPLHGLAGRLLVLDRPGTADARLMALVAREGTAMRGELLATIAGATDVIGVSEPMPHTGEAGAPAVLLFVARRPGDDLECLRLPADGAGPQRLPPWKVRDYDGGGLAATPDARVVFFTTGGSLRHAVPARVRWLRTGTVTSFRLDGGAFRMRWGRVFLDACMPTGTRVRVRCLVADEPPGDASVSWQPPANIGTSAVARVRHPELTPPLPPSSLVPATDAGFTDLHRRSEGCEVPWVRPAPGDAFATYEAPIHGAPGRYLWIQLELTGDGRQSPRLRAVRAEFPGHDTLRRLPRVYSRDPHDEDFLRRFLAPVRGLLDDLDARAGSRHALIDPASAPEGALPWLASFVGLVTDQRWSVVARRRLIAEAACLFRFRGTVLGLRRFLELAVGERPMIIEHYRLRGAGSIRVGDATEQTTRAIVGAGLRVGGAVGDATARPLADRQGRVDDGVATHAHRFSVYFAVSLDAEQTAIAHHVLDMHRPAHTLYELCSVDAGLRVGLGAHVGLSTAIGPTSGFATLRLGHDALGRGTILGRPDTGTVPGASALGYDSYAG